MPVHDSRSAFMPMFTVLCDPQCTPGERSILLIASRENWGSEKWRHLLKPTQSWDWNPGPPDSELCLLFFLCSGSISLSSNSIYIYFLEIIPPPLNLCCSDKDVCTPSFRGAYVIQAQANHCMFSPLFKDGHMTQVRPIFQLNKKEQGVPLATGTGGYKGAVSLNPLSAIVETLIMEASKRKLR